MKESSQSRQGNRSTAKVKEAVFEYKEIPLNNAAHGTLRPLSKHNGHRKLKQADAPTL